MSLSTPHLLLAALLIAGGSLVGCDEGFRPIAADGALDGAPTDGPQRADRAASDQSPPPPEGGCGALKRSFGPVVLGFGETYSVQSSLAMAASRVAAVWERVSYDNASTHFAALQSDGNIAAQARQLDQGSFDHGPAIAALGDKGFAVVYVRNAEDSVLVYQRLDAAGATLETKELASNPGGGMSGVAIAAGAAGIAVGFTRYGADKQGEVQLGKIDEHGTIVEGFLPLSGNGQSWNIDLRPTSDGFFATWTESRPADCWAVVAAWLDASLTVPLSPGKVVVADDQTGCYQHASAALLGQDALVCAEHVVADTNTTLVCRLLKGDGQLSEFRRVSVPGLSSRRPRVVAGGGDYALFWTGTTTGLEEVHGRLFTVDGELMGDAQRLSEDGVRSFYPQAVWTGDGFFAAWYRYVPITVYYAAYYLRCEGG